MAIMAIRLIGEGQRRWQPVGALLRNRPDWPEQQSDLLQSFMKALVNSVRNRPSAAGSDASTVRDVPSRGLEAIQ